MPQLPYKSRRLLGPSVEGAIVPVDPPPVDGAIMDAESLLADTMVPVTTPCFQSYDQMVAADGYTQSRDRGVAAYIEQDPVYEQVGDGTVYKCKAK